METILRKAAGLPAPAGEIPTLSMMIIRPKGAPSPNPAMVTRMQSAGRTRPARAGLAELGWMAGCMDFVTAPFTPVWSRLFR